MLPNQYSGLVLTNFANLDILIVILLVFMSKHLQDLLLAVVSALTPAQGVKS